MSRTYHATGTGSFTRAFEVRRDRSQLRKYNEDDANLTKQEFAPMFGATREHREGRITYEEARQLIRNGDKIRTPDGILHKVTKENREELIGRLGATVEYPAKNAGFAPKGSNIMPRGRIEVFKGNLSNPKSTKAKIGKDGRVKGESRGQKGKALRTGTGPYRNLLPLLLAAGAGARSRSTSKGTLVDSTRFGYKTKQGPSSTYKTSPNSKKTEIKKGENESKGNVKLRAREAKAGGFLPRSTKAVRQKAAREKEKQRKSERSRKGGRTGRGRSR